MFKSAAAAMFLASLSLALLAGSASHAQDMTGLDATSDAFTKSEMSRTEIEFCDLPPAARKHPRSQRQKSQRP